MLALPVRFARTLLTLGLRRKLLVFPRIAGTILAASLAVAVVIALATRSALAWRLLATASLLLLAAEAWRARPSFGRARRLPPGSLALAPLGPWVNPEFHFAQSERHGPVFKMSHLVSPQVCIVDLETGRDLLRRYDAALAVPPLPFDRLVPGGFIRYMEPEPHRARSATLRTAISKDVVAAAEPVVQGMMCAALAELARDEGALHPRARLDTMVFHATGHLFFGFAPGSETLARFERAMRAIDYRRALRVPPFRVRRALSEAMALLLNTEPGGFLGALAAADPAAAREPAVVANLLYMFNTAWADVAGLMAWMTKWLAANSEWLARLRGADDPAAMAERIVRETLRLSQSEYIVRRAREPLEVGGFVIPSGWLVRVCIREIHRRSDVFPEATRFLPDRFLNPPGPQVYAPFGASRISCLGENVTLLFGRLLALELARGYEIAVAEDGPLELGPFHWQPSSRFRVRLTPLARPS